MKWPSFLKPQNTTLSKPDDWLVKALLGSATASGVKVSPITALSVPTVFACVNAVSRSMSSIPLKLYRRTANGGKEVAVDHPLYALIHDAPNPEMTSADFRRAVQANAPGMSLNAEVFSQDLQALAPQLAAARIAQGLRRIIGAI